MWDIVTFNAFVAQDILLFFYYIFALLMPFLLWKFRLYILKKVSFYERLSQKNKVVVIVLFMMIFVCMELCLRMIFEAMIGYFDMHDYLYTITQELQKGKLHE